MAVSLITVEEEPGITKSIGDLSLRHPTLFQDILTLSSSADEVDSGASLELHSDIAHP